MTENPWKWGLDDFEEESSDSPKLRRNRDLDGSFQDNLHESLKVTWWDLPQKGRGKIRPVSDSLIREIMDYVVRTVMYWALYVVAISAIAFIPLFAGLFSQFTAQYSIILVVSWSLLLSQLKLKEELVKYPDDYSMITKFTTAVAEFLYYNVLTVIIIALSAIVHTVVGPHLAVAIAVFGPVLDVKAYRNLNVSIAGFFSFYGFWSGRIITAAYYRSPHSEIPQMIGGFIMWVTNTRIRAPAKLFTRYFVHFLHQSSSPTYH